LTIGAGGGLMRAMSEPAPLSGPSYGPVAGGAPRQVVVLLHGVGADGNDLIGLAPDLAQVLPHAEFISPDAPQPFDMAPFGRQWFRFTGMEPEELLAGVTSTVGILDAFLTHVLEARGLTEADMALIGFSQGSSMALHVAPRRPRALAGVLAYSGFLAGNALSAEEVTSRPPVLLVHGEADPIVPFEAMGLAEQALKTAGVPVQAIARPGLAHGIDEEGLRLGAAFLAKAFAGES